MARRAPITPGFTLNPRGHLTPISDSVPPPETAIPGDILFNPTGTHLIGVEVGTRPSASRVDGFLVGTDGRLTPAGGSPVAAQAAGPFGTEFSPTSPNNLYVSNAHAGPGAGSVSAYSVGPNGALIIDRRLALPL